MNTPLDNNVLSLGHSTDFHKDEVLISEDIRNFSNNSQQAEYATMSFDYINQRKSDSGTLFRNTNHKIRPSRLIMSEAYPSL